MSQKPDEPTTAAPANSIAPVGRLAKQQARMRMWQAKAKQSTQSEKTGAGYPKRRPAPSMPKLPWNDQ